jgi:2-(1,2-epoxy-1,2-dihydrophenyl)acetyl-CoA isomerase
MSSVVSFEKNNGVATITMNQVEKMNALTPEITSGLWEATEQAHNDADVKVVVLTGTGKAFCAGGDINNFLGGSTAMELADRFQSVHHKWLNAFYTLPKPTIASVNGFAVGAGFGVALLCDVVFSAESAKFGLSFVNVGLVPDYALAYMLPRLIGLQRTKELAFSGRNLTAREACDWGLVNAVLPDGELAEHVSRYAAKLAQGPACSYAYTKRLLNEGLDMNLTAFLQAESYAQTMLLRSEDAKEAANAFLDKRKPVFKGK